MSALDDLNRWAREDDEDAQPKSVDFYVVQAPAFKAKGHGTWAWRKGLKADRGAKSLVDPRDEGHLWLSPRSQKRRRIDKSQMVDEAIRSTSSINLITLADRRI
jgi:hypothetical protein